MVNVQLYTTNSVGYVLCECDVRLVTTGRLKTFTQMRKAMKALMQAIPCGKCNRLVGTGSNWSIHYFENHLPLIDEDVIHAGIGRTLRLLLYVLPEHCRICDIFFESRQAFLDHASLHIKKFDEFPLYQDVFMPVFQQLYNRMNLIEKEIYVTTNLFMSYFNKPLALRLYVPGWLPGKNIKEKFANISNPTPIYITMDPNQRPENLESYDVYKVDLYSPQFDPDYKGVRTWLANFLKFWIRVNASLTMSLNECPNLQFMFIHRPENSKMRLLLEMANLEDITSSVNRVLTTKCGLLCKTDLQVGNKCIDDDCYCLLHVQQNVKLTRKRAHRIQAAITPQRLRTASLGIGFFNFCKSDGPETIELFSAHIQHAINTPVLFFVYVAMLERYEDSVVEGTEKKSIYFGVSREPMIPNHHLAVTRVDYGANDDDDDDMEDKNETQEEERVELQNQVDPNNEQPMIVENVDVNQRDSMREISVDENEAEEDDNNETEDVSNDEPPVPSITGILLGTALSKKYCLGHYKLYIVKQYKLNSAREAMRLEAALQFYGKLSNKFNPDVEVDYINERIEISKLAFLSRSEIGVILNLVANKVRYCYETQQDYDALEVTPDWGIFQGPAFMEQKFQCVPFIPE